MPPLPRPYQLGKAAAVISSIVLVSLYVAYRSGGQTTLPGSKGGVLGLNQTSTSNPASAPTTTTTFIISEPQVIYSTKSAPVFKPSTFSGSKSGVVFHPSDASALQPAAPQPTTAPSQVPLAAPLTPPPSTPPLPRLGAPLPDQPAAPAQQPIQQQVNQR
jgi:hypothetical protein